MFPKIAEVNAAFVQAGRELALGGRISAAAARRASQEIVPVPLFGLLKRLPFRPVREKFLERAARSGRAAETR